MAQFNEIIGEIGWLHAMRSVLSERLPPEYVDKRTRGFGIYDLHLSQESVKGLAYRVGACIGASMVACCLFDAEEGLFTIRGQGICLVGHPPPASRRVRPCAV